MRTKRIQTGKVGVTAGGKRKIKVKVSPGGDLGGGLRRQWQKRRPQNCQRGAQTRQFSRIERRHVDEGHAKKIRDLKTIPGDYAKKPHTSLACFGRASCHPKQFRYLSRAEQAFRAGFFNPQIKQNAIARNIRRDIRKPRTWSVSLFSALRNLAQKTKTLSPNFYLIGGNHTCTENRVSP